MKYLLDTCVISDFIKGELKTITHLKQVPPIEIAVSTITVMEIVYGLELNPSRSKIIKTILYDFLNSITILDFNQKDAAQAGVIRAELKQHGCPIGSYDILLAGVALNRKLILVSANIKEFKRVVNLSLENWRDE